MKTKSNRSGRFNADLNIASRGGGVTPAPRDLAEHYGNQKVRGKFSRGLALTPAALKRTGLKEGMKVRIDQRNVYSVRLIEELTDGRKLASLNKVYARGRS